MDPVKKLKEYLENESNVVFAVMFGSEAKGTQRKDSDIDIGIYFTMSPEGIELLQFTTRLSDLAGKDVDVAVLNTASAFLRHQAMKYRVPLIIKDYTIYREFREKTIADYDEYKYISGLNG
ncbi:MAG: nucleotidyltransferase domain-containing protein [Nitrospirota bacterium]